MNKKNLPHIISVVSIVVFMALGLASATTPTRQGYAQTIKNDTGSTVLGVYTRDTGIFTDRSNDWREHVRGEKDEKILLDNGTQTDIFYPQWISESNKDIRIVDTNGIVYIKFNVPIALKTIDSAGKVIDNSDIIIFNAQDRQPMLTIHNNTGYPIDIYTRTTDFVRQNMDNEASIFFFPDLRQNQNITVVYNIGVAEYDEQVTMSNDDVTLNLTRSPPAVTIENNTGNTVNFIYVRNPGANWSNRNLLTFRVVYRTHPINRENNGWVVEDQSTMQSTERRGSITNRDSFRLWFGNISAKPDRYDIRIDDVQGNSYVKSNVQITQDMTLTFTPSDKR